MRFDIFTLFPGFFESPFSHSILKRAQERELISLGVHDIRAWTTDKHHVCDDTPYGGGAGMVLKAEPLARAVEDVLKWDAGHLQNGGALSEVNPSRERALPPCPVIFLTPGGRTLTQRVVEELAAHPRLALICGHYEGVDERAIELLCTDEISIGDYVLTGGEAAALIVVEAVARLVDGVLGNAESAGGESFSHDLLEAPHYTRPVEWRGRGVPDVLLSGHHAEIEKWRLREGLKRTLRRRPDLAAAARERGLSASGLTAKNERKIWAEVLAEHANERELMGGGNDESEFDTGGSRTPPES